mmetsp:Transcript_35018/g.90725  ORF Transcript_35018/g.90725 Transcript_35018/m.90725 type:complete len:754 (-) Transcript_35018:217-2478(-)
MKAVISTGVLPGFPVSVDAFTTQGAFSGIKAYFLTHFHTDHYGGLTPRFPSNRKIYCSRVTRSLVLHTFHLDPNSVIPLDEGTTISMCVDDEYFSVTPIDAHHCAGSFMFLFEKKGYRVLHCGDCRVDRQHGREIRRAIGDGSAIDLAIVDATFAHKKWKIPPRTTSIREVMQLSHTFSDLPLYIWNDTLGVEELLLAVANEKKERIHATGEWAERLKLIPSMHDFITDDPFSTSIHCCKSRECMRKVVERNGRKQYEVNGIVINALTIRPSTLFFERFMSSPADTPVWCQVGPAFRVLYSMHSSADELRAFISELQPTSLASSTPVEVSVWSSLLRDVDLAPLCHSPVLSSPHTRTGMKKGGVSARWDNVGRGSSSRGAASSLCSLLNGVKRRQKPVVGCQYDLPAFDSDEEEERGKKKGVEKKDERIEEGEEVETEGEDEEEEEEARGIEGEVVAASEKGGEEKEACADEEDVIIVSSTYSLPAVMHTAKIEVEKEGREGMRCGSGYQAGGEEEVAHYIHTVADTKAKEGGEERRDANSVAQCGSSNAEKGSEIEVEDMEVDDVILVEDMRCEKGQVTTSNVIDTARKDGCSGVFETMAGIAGEWSQRGMEVEKREWADVKKGERVKESGTDAGRSVSAPPPFLSLHDVSSKRNSEGVVGGGGRRMSLSSSSLFASVKKWCDSRRVAGGKKESEDEQQRMEEGEGEEEIDKKEGKRKRKSESVSESAYVRSALFSPRLHSPSSFLTLFTPK